MLKWIILGIIFYVIAGFSTSLIIQIHDSNVRDPFNMWTIDGHLEPSEIVAITFLWPMVALCMIWIYGIPKLFMGMYKLFVLIIFSIKAVMDTIALSSSEKPNQSETPTSSDHLSSELAKNSKKLEKITAKNILGVDAISREKAIMWAKFYTDIYDAEVANEEIMKMLRDMPSVTPIRPKGHWITETTKHNRHLGSRNGYCSVCKDFYTDDWDIMNYCPNCGADMREVEEE